MVVRGTCGRGGVIGGLGCWVVVHRSTDLKKSFPPFPASGKKGRPRRNKCRGKGEGRNKLRLTLRRCHWQRMGEIKEQDIWKDRYRGKCYRGSDTVPDITSCRSNMIMDSVNLISRAPNIMY